MRIVPASVKLNKRHARKPIGYRVLNVDRTLYRSFTRFKVDEPIPAYYVASGGVEVSDSGGYIAWGSQLGQTIIEDSIDPIPASPSQEIVSAVSMIMDGHTEAVTGLVTRVNTAISDDISTVLSILADLADMKKKMDTNKAELAEAVRDAEQRIAIRLNPQNAQLSYLDALVTRLEESTDSEIDLGNRLTSIARSMSNIQSQVMESIHRLSDVEAAIKSGDSADERMVESLKVLREFEELFQ